MLRLDPPPPPPVRFECFRNRPEMTLFFTMGYPHNLQIVLCSLRSKGKKEVLTMTTATPRTTPSKKSFILLSNVATGWICSGRLLRVSVQRTASKSKGRYEQLAIAVHVFQNTFDFVILR